MVDVNERLTFYSKTANTTFWDLNTRYNILEKFGRASWSRSTFPKTKRYSSCSKHSRSRRLPFVVVYIIWTQRTHFWILLCIHNYRRHLTVSVKKKISSFVWSMFIAKMDLNPSRKKLHLDNGVVSLKKTFWQSFTTTWKETGGKKAQNHKTVLLISICWIKGFKDRFPDQNSLTYVSFRGVPAYCTVQYQLVVSTQSLCSLLSSSWKTWGRACPYTWKFC